MAASAFCRLVLGGVAALFLSACNSGSGYVELKVPPGMAVPGLHIDTARVEPLKGGTAVLRQRAGLAKLQVEREGRLIPICEFTVKKDRIVTVTLTGFVREPRCRVQN